MRLDQLEELEKKAIHRVDRLRWAHDYAKKALSRIDDALLAVPSGEAYEEILEFQWMFTNAVARIEQLRNLSKEEREQARIRILAKMRDLAEPGDPPIGSLVV